MRSANDVIDQAIRENRGGEILIYTYTVLIVLTGLGLIIGSMIQKQPIMSLAGAAENVLLWPAFRAAERIRNIKIALRMLEIPLNMAKTAEEAAKMLKQVFERHFSPGIGSVKPTPLQKG
jgi:hypothetical protein